jgi:carbamoyl-phosphate synthase large subunit
VAGEVGMVINTPSGRYARADGYAIRAAATSMDRPIITTVQQLGAAVQGIESQLTETVRVKSLQDHARELNFYARTEDQA